MNRIIEPRAYNLKPGTRARFHQLIIEQSLSLLHCWQVDVVAYEPVMTKTRTS